MMEQELKPTLIHSMVDITKQVTYWRDSAKEDWAVAAELVHGNRQCYGLFFAQLALVLCGSRTWPAFSRVRSNGTRWPR